MLRLKELRKAKGLTQEEMISQFNERYGKQYGAISISMFENGKRIPETQSLMDFADFFGVSSDYLLGLSDIARPPAAPSSTPSLAPQDKELLHKYHALTDEHKGLLNGQLDAMYNLDKPKAKDMAT